MGDGGREGGRKEGIESEQNCFVPLQKGKRKRKGSVAVSDSHSGLDWSLERVKVVEVMCEMVESDLSSLWEPPSPQMMEDFSK